LINGTFLRRKQGAISLIFQKLGIKRGYFAGFNPQFSEQSNMKIKKSNRKSGGKVHFGD
jgi:hypothetical protein